MHKEKYKFNHSQGNGYVLHIKQRAIKVKTYILQHGYNHINIINYNNDYNDNKYDDKDCNSKNTNDNDKSE